MCKQQLCISGGGVRGISFAAVIYELQKHGYLKLQDLETISAVSIGAFLGILLLIEYDFKEVLDILFDYDFTSLKDVDMKRFITNKSIMKGKAIHNFFAELIARKKNPLTTLQELYKDTHVTFIVAVTCINTQKIEYISYLNYPHLTLLKLLQMTTAIPGILPPVNYNDKLYVDGALLDNLPLRVLDFSKEIIVIVVDRMIPKFIETHCLHSFFNFFSILVKLLYRNNDPEIIESFSTGTTIKVINVKIGNVSVTSFNITKDNKFSLIHFGKLAAQQFISVSASASASGSASPSPSSP